MTGLFMAGPFREAVLRRNSSARYCVHGGNLRFLLILGSALMMAAAPVHAARRCYSAAYAARHPHQKLCVKAHVYQEIRLGDGTRILDICSPHRSASDCRFAFASLEGRHTSVGSLKQYVGKEIEVRGEIQPIRGRAEILLSRAKQIHAVTQPEHSRQEEADTGRGRFHPNPALLKGFNATQTRMPIAAPAFRSRDGN